MVLLKSQTKLNIGDEAPDFSLVGTDDKEYSLSDFKAKALLVVFMCNHCPYVVPKIKSLVSLQEKFKNNLQIVGINPNSANLDYPDDSFEKMKDFVKNKKINFVYLNDERQKVAKAYGAVCTPDPFLFKDGKLFYHGQIDGKHGEEGDGKSIQQAVEALLSGKQQLKSLPSIGCSIKWIE